MRFTKVGVVKLDGLLPHTFSSTLDADERVLSCGLTNNVVHYHCEELLLPRYRHISIVSKTDIPTRSFELCAALQ